MHKPEFDFVYPVSVSLVWRVSPSAMKKPKYEEEIVEPSSTTRMERLDRFSIHHRHILITR